MTNRQAVRSCPRGAVEHFGDSMRLADELLREVTPGAQRATSELTAVFVADGDELSRIGSHWIAYDSTGLRASSCAALNFAWVGPECRRIIRRG